MFSIIIPTMQKNTDILNMLLKELADDSIVGEIIIIDNSLKGFCYHSDKVKVIIPKKNLFVNNAWNLGVEKAKYNYIGILNDDIILPKNFCEQISTVLSQNSEIGLCGLDSTILYNTDKSEFNEYPQNSILNFVPINNDVYIKHWGSAIFGKKENFYKIPSNLKVWCGDNYLLKRNTDNNKTCYAIKNVQIKHLGSLTCANPYFNEIKSRDIYNYSKIDKRFKQHTHYKKPLSILQRIFSIKNEGERKVFRVLGFKISKKYNKNQKYQSKKYRIAYANEIIERNVKKSDCFVPLSKEQYNNCNNTQLIAFYLPQFHTFKENEEWHGKGFTEWTNVTKAIPQFTGHHQPQLPIDVGFYDLSTDKIMYRQIELAKQYGISGFCFYYYWFSGKRLMEKPIFNYLNNKDLNFPFCLCWANENWSRRWDGGDNEVLIEQKLQDGDGIKFIQDIMPFFKDERYIKINNKPVLIIYKAQLFDREKMLTFIEEIRNGAKEAGFDDLYIMMARTTPTHTPKDFGIDAAVEFPPHLIDSKLPIYKQHTYINPNFFGRIFDITNFIKNKSYLYNTDYTLYKTVFPGWDNTARKAYIDASVFETEPNLYKDWLKGCIDWTKQHNKDTEQFVFINAWNEWAEGAHLEPDQKYGYAYLQATKEALEETE